MSSAMRGTSPLLDNKNAYKFYGMFAGFIRDVDDPDKRGRLRAYVPTLMGGIDDSDHWLDWALPSFPWVVSQGTGKPGAAGFIPAAGAPDQDKWGVWIQFVDGDLKYPIWTGVYALGELNQDELRWTGGDKVVIDGGGSTLILDKNGAQLNGQDYPLPKFDLFEKALSTFGNVLLAVLDAGTQGTPVAQQLVGLKPVRAQLAKFLTELTSGTYDSTKARNG